MQRVGLWAAAGLATVALCACVGPLGPTIPVAPGPGKSFAAFAADQETCRQYADAQVGPQAAYANSRAVGSALLGTALGAGLGGGGRDRRRVERRRLCADVAAAATRPRLCRVHVRPRQPRARLQTAARRSGLRRSAFRSAALRSARTAAPAAGLDPAASALSGITGSPRGSGETPAKAGVSFCPVAGTRGGEQAVGEVAAADRRDEEAGAIASGVARRHDHCPFAAIDHDKGPAWRRRRRAAAPGSGKPGRRPSDGGGAELVRLLGVLPALPARRAEFSGEIEALDMARPIGAFAAVMIADEGQQRDPGVIMHRGHAPARIGGVEAGGAALLMARAQIVEPRHRLAPKGPARLVQRDDPRADERGPIDAAAALRPDKKLEP